MVPGADRTRQSRSKKAASFLAALLLRTKVLVDRNSLELGTALFRLVGADVARDKGAVIAVQGKIGAGGRNGIRGDKVERRQRIHDKGIAGIVRDRVAAVAGVR